jgi:hypothetical protein
VDNLSKQNSTNYEPTEKEKNLLEVLINPDYRMKSITDICKAAKCTRNIYYNAFEKPGFVEEYNRRSANLVKQSVGSVINTFIREAQRGSFQHGKVLLEMAGLYTENSKVEIAGTMPVQIIDDIPKDDEDGEN